MSSLRERVRTIVEGYVRQYMFEDSKKNKSDNDNNKQRAKRHLEEPMTNATAVAADVLPKNWKDSTRRS
jgi:hypothetical protein